MSDLKALIERVREANGADTMLDHDLEWHFGEWQNLGGWWRKHKVTGEEQRYSYAPAPAYTASIDAALALVERLTPIGPMVSHELNHSLARDGEEFWNFRIKTYSPDEGEEPEVRWGTAWTAPLAILTALLSTLTQDSPNVRP